MNKDIRQALCDMGHDDAIIFDYPDYDEAIIGVTDGGRVVYDYDKMVQCLMDEMTEDEAVEFIEYNTIRALHYAKNPPIIMHRLLYEEVKSDGE